MGAYRALLHLFPASFRKEYGPEMCAMFARRQRGAQGPVAALALWLGAVTDVLPNAARVHGDILRQDLRYTARSLLRSPGFTTTAILVAALGIGATTAMFSITDHVLLRPLPFPDAQRLVAVWQDQTSRGYGRMELSPANYRDFKRLATSFEAMAVYTTRSFNLVGDGEPQRIDGAAFSADMFAVLGVQPAIGRSFTEADDREGAPGTLLLSHRLWQARFGGGRSVLGRTVVLDDESFVIIGVMPRDFYFPNREAALYTPMRFRPDDFADRTNTYLYSVAKLGPGITLERARAEMQAAADQLARQYPENVKTGAAVIALRDQVSDKARLMVAALLGAALCVLLISCTNLANLLMARALERRHELAVRTALGAGRERLVRQLLTESLVLAFCGGALGLLLATSAVPLAARLVPTTLPISEVPELNVRVLAFAGLLAGLTGIAFGVVPALRTGGRSNAADLREGARGGVGGSRARLRSVLVVAEVTVSVVLLISAGLLIRALWRVQQVDPGFRAEGVLTLRTTLPFPRYASTDLRHRFYTQVIAEARQLPGVTQAAYTSFLPLVMRGGIWNVGTDGRPIDPAAPAVCSLRYVTPGFFSALGVPVRQGREVAETDTGQGPFVAVVSESFARQHWPALDPLGRQLDVAFFPRTVVGVVGDVRTRGLERTSEAQVYLPQQQIPDGYMPFYAPKDLVVRSSASPAVLVPALRAIIARVDPQQPISDVRMLTEIVGAETGARSVQVRVLVAFAGIAVLLAGIGIHGLLAFTVSNRQREIGVRMALGAERRDILELVLRDGLRLVACGLAVGVVTAYVAGRSLEALLAGVSPRDAVTFAAAVALALLMTMVGSLVPALRASRVDPLEVIRAE